MDIYVMTPDLIKLGVIDNYESSIWTDRYNECGDFELRMPITPQVLSMCKIGYYLVCAESEHGMIIETINITSDADDGDRLTITGRSLESILDRRVLWGNYTLEGGLQDIIFYLLYDNAIEPEDESRAIPNLRFAYSEDPNITSLKTSVQYTGTNLYDAICNICKTVGVGFKLIFADDGWFEFSLFIGENRSFDQIRNPYIVFSPTFENILNSEYLCDVTKYKNATLIGGEGDGDEKRFAAYNPYGAYGLYRRETYTDAKSVSSKTRVETVTKTGKPTTKQEEISPEEYTKLLIQKGDEELDKHSITESFEGEGDAHELFVYGRDFFIGDIVQVEDSYGHQGKAYISELVISDDANGYSEYPTFVSLNKGDN